MSRIGKKPVEIPAGVDVKVDGSRVTVKGSLGEMAYDLPAGITASLDGGRLIVERDAESREKRSMHGLSRSLIANMVEGVSKGYTRTLVIEGVGFRATVQGNKLSLAVGFSSPVEYVPPEGVTITEQGGTKIVVTGIDKQKVGQAAARIRAFAPAEPYKGKGVRYEGEHIRRKVGKTVA